MTSMTLAFTPIRMEISENKAGMIIHVNVSPKALPRPTTKDKLRQNITMMHFQQLVMKEARGALRAKSLGIFNNDLSIEIEITSIKSPQYFNLEDVLKAIFDGLNKHVIYDDSLISHAQIWLNKAPKRYPKTIIKVHIEDLVTRDSISFTLDLPSIEKRNPVVYNINASLNYDLQAAKDIARTSRSFSLQNFTPVRQYEICHMLFYTSDLSKDIDNMFFMYIDSIRDKGFLDYSNNIGIGMYKRHADKDNERTIINLVSK